MTDITDKFKNFFKKTKVDLKFKKAGPGHRLNEESKKPAPQLKEPTYSRVEPTAEAKQAAAAALARLQNTCGTSGITKPSLYNKVKSEITQEVKLSNKGDSTDESANVHSKNEKDMTHFAARGVYFRCFISDELLTKNEWKSKIREYLYQCLENDEAGMVPCTIIHNCNKNAEKTNLCVETLIKYLKNIIDNPSEEKYRKIRLSNRAFQEKVAGTEGAFEFLKAAGFTREQLNTQDGSEEFFIMSQPSASDIKKLEELVQNLKVPFKFTLQLDRNVQVLRPSQAKTQRQIPDDFYRYTPDEIKREQQLRTEAVDSASVLITKAMREKHKKKEMKKYRYAIIRIRFPDNLILQGTFSVYEKYDDIVKFVKENLCKDCEFSLRIADANEDFTDEDLDKTLFDLHLVPATLLNFRCADSTMLSYLKPDIEILLQSL